MTRKLTVAALGLLVTLLAGPPATAAEGDDLSWGVQPSSPTGPDGRDAFDYQVAPGTVVRDWVAVTNRSTSPVVFRIYAADATTDYDTGTFTLIGSDRPSVDVGAWTSLDEAPSSCPDAARPQVAACLAGLGTELTLDAGERADIPFALSVPHDAAPGDHAGGIVAVHTSEAPTDGGATVLRESRVGTRIYLRVDGAVSVGLSGSGVVSGYDGTRNPVGRGTAYVGFDLVNSGNVRLSAQPTVALTGPFGIELGEWTLPEVANVMPGKTVHVTSELPGVPPLLMLFADVTVTPVVADGVVNSTDAPPPAWAASTRTWAVPWTWLVGVALLACGTWLVVALRRRSRVRLAADLADYAEQVRTHFLAAGGPPTPDPDPGFGPLSGNESAR